MDRNAAHHDTLRRATQHLENLLQLTTPGKPAQTAASEAEAIANLAFLEGNPVRELFLTSAPRSAHERQRSPSPTATIRPKSSKAFFPKFGRGSKEKSSSAPGSSSSGKQPWNDTTALVSPLFEQIYGPLEYKQPKKAKRKEHENNATPPISSTGMSKSVPVASSSTVTPAKPPARSFEQYKCIVCEAELSSKGVCKRHLEDQHICPKVYECEGCHAYFDAKAEAKKHCSQCGNGDLSWVAAKLAKKVYACEYTGSYFMSLERYSQHLLVLSEHRESRPLPNLNVKLEAIIRYAVVHNEALRRLVSSISQSLFGSEDAWKDLHWNEDFLRQKIAVLEHATFNPDGTITSARWTGLQPKLRNTESYITQLFQAGQQSEDGSYLKSPPSEAMSVCSTLTTGTQPSFSVAAGRDSARPPHRVISPLPHLHNTQSTWSTEGAGQHTRASTPRSGQAGEEVLTAELKSKRHLSDESRSYMPARTPPGPPDLPDHFQYTSDPSFSGSAPQLPPLPAFMTPSSSTVSLPLRHPEPNGLPATQEIVSAPQCYPTYHMDPASSSSHTLPSDVASETSTLAQSYSEPEPLESVPVYYSLWHQQQQQMDYNNQQHQIPHDQAYAPYGNFDYSMADDASMVASSVQTGPTIMGYVTHLPKMDDFAPEVEMAHQHHLHPSNNTPSATFYFPDSGDERDEHMR